MKMSDRANPIPDSACTACGHVMNWASGIGTDNAPSPGDVTLCICCGHLMVFTAGLTLRDPTDEEIHEIAGDPALVAASRALKAAR